MHLYLGKTMKSRRFPSSKSRLFRIPLIILVMALLAGAVLYRLEKWGAPTILAAVVVALSLLAMLLMRRIDEIVYELDDRSLLLRRGAELEKLDLVEVRDANLIDLVTAHHYIRLQGRGAIAADEVEPAEVITRFCSIPLALRMRLGLARLSSLSVRSFQRTLVLIRTEDERLLILSPRAGEHMVSVMGKALARTRAEQA